MIEKMNFLSITGPKADIDRVVNTYLCKYEIHLENALSELTTVESLTPFLEVNPYRDALNSINTIYEELKTPPATSNRSPGIETALPIFFAVSLSLSLRNRPTACDAKAADTSLE